MKENDDYDLILILSFIGLFFFIGIIVCVLACIFEIDDINEQIELLYDLLGVTL